MGIIEQSKLSRVAVRIPNAWYIVCRSKELRQKPLQRQLLGIPMVIFRGDGGRVGALLDNCPHRNVPLSLGRVREGLLECPYHGWQFDAEGRCKTVPSLCTAAMMESRRCDAFPCLEQDGVIWVWPQVGASPTEPPFRFDYLESPGYTSVHETLDAPGSVHAVAENALDVPHTRFLHGGLFRKESRALRIDVDVRRWHDRVEAQYLGEPRPTGVIGQVLAPQGGEVEHYDRFILPSIFQVEYRLGNNHLLITGALTPLADYRTRMFTTVSFKLPLPGQMVVPLIKPVILKVFAQDAVILEAQAKNIERFGGERFMSTEVDVLGPQILQLMRQKARDKLIAPTTEPVCRRVQMEI